MSDTLFPHPYGEQTSLDVSSDKPSNPADLLDQPQPFAHATSFQVRDAFQRLIERDLLGPWDGEHERFEPKARGPRDRYLVGMLGPRHHASQKGDAALPLDTSTGVAGETQGEENAELP